MAIDPITGYQIAKQIPFIGEPIGDAVGGITNLIQSGIKKMPHGETILDLLPGNKKREYLSFVENYKGDPDSGMKILEQARMNGTIDNDTYKQASIILKLRSQSNNDERSQGRQNIDTAKKSLEMAMESALNTGDINQYSELSEEYKKYSGLNKGLEMFRNIQGFDAGGDVDTQQGFYDPYANLNLPSPTGVASIDAANFRLAGGGGGRAGGGNRMPRPVARPVGRPQPMPVAPQPAPQQGGGMFNLGSGVMNQIGSALPVNNVNPQVGMGMPSPPQMGSLNPPQQGGGQPITDMMVKPPYTGAGNVADPNYISSILRNETGLDATTKQMLFGLDGKGGFIPGAMQAAESTFFNPDGTPRVADQTVAGFNTDQERAMEMARNQAGIQDRFLTGAESAYQSGLGTLQTGRGDLSGRLSESEDLLRQTTGAYDPSMSDNYFNQFEDKVVQQTIKDLRDSGAQQEIGQIAGNIGRGGESAFGSRANLGSMDRESARERGLMEAISGIRGGGLDRARQLGRSDFSNLNQARRSAAAGLGGFAANRFGADQTLGGAFTGFGSNLANLGGARQQAGAFDINQLLGAGGMQQGLSQEQLNAARANQIARNQAPLNQYNALAPFISMAPSGTFQTSTQFSPKPSAIQAGLGTGLSAFGALGNYMNPRTR
tara:strand:+ start:487 stop:2469 length:1983 start_codon:yes stop_codon:yes gene_type:complete